MKKRKLLSILLALAMVLTMIPAAVFADGGTVNLNDPNSWKTDRTEPVGFNIQNGKITFSVSEQPSQDGFYAWQGRKAYTDQEVASYWKVSYSIDVTESMLESENVNASMWVQVDKDGENGAASQNDCVDWSIVQFINTDTIKWQAWDSSGSGTWKDITGIDTVKGVYKIDIEFFNGTITQFINGIQINTYEISEKETSPAALIAQGRSYGASFDVSMSVPEVAKSFKQIEAENTEELFAALSCAENSVIILTGGEYDVTKSKADGMYGSGFAITKDNITVKAADPADKPVIYGFANEFNAGLDDGINGQDTIYVSGKNATLENLVILPLGGIGENANAWQKTVEVTAGAEGFSMTGCETKANDKTKDGIATSMKDSAGLIHISTNDAELTSNTFGEGTTICSGWKTFEGNEPKSFYVVDASGNDWTDADIGSHTDGIVIVDGNVYVNHSVALAQVVENNDLSENTICIVGDDPKDVLGVEVPEGMVPMIYNAGEIQLIPEDMIDVEAVYSYVADGITYYAKSAESLAETLGLEEDTDIEQIAYYATFYNMSPAGVISDEPVYQVVVPEGKTLEAAMKANDEAFETELKAPVYDGFDFAGWYTLDDEGAFDEKADFSKKINADTDYYSAYEKAGAAGTTDPADTAKPDSSAQTGDDFNMAIPFAAAGLALAALAAAVATRKRHN